MNDDKLLKAFALLGAALDASAADPEDALGQAALAKTFESTFEYVWRHFKREADEAGLETYSPRDALKSAAQLRLIEDLELWNQFLNARNLSVHDYVGMDQAATLSIVRQFRDEVQRLIGD
jgi:nucleotidyltransferase substrate binding protein (TIGR01987 family)